MSGKEKNQISVRKKIVYILITVFLILLVISTVNEKVDAYINSDIELSLSGISDTHTGNDILVNYGADNTLTLVSQSENGSAWIEIPTKGVSADIIFITADVKKTVSLSYSLADNAESVVEVKPTVLDDGRMMFHCLYPVGESVRINVKDTQTVKISQIRTVGISEFNTYYAPNVVSLCVLFALLIILCIFNKKIGYFSEMCKAIKNVFAESKTVLKERGKIVFAVHVASFFLIFIFVCLAVFDFTFNIVSPTYSLVTLTVASLSVFGFILDQCIVKKSPKVATVLIVTVLLLGTMIVLISPITTQVGWDDGYHYANTSYFSALLTNKGKIPASVYAFSKDRYPALSFNEYSSEMVGSMLYFSEYATNEVDMANVFSVFRDFKWYYVFAVLLIPFAAVYYLFTYMAYIPGNIAIMLTSLFGADFVKCFLIGKIANVICYALLVFFAVRRLKKSGSYIFSAIALLPICVFLGASYSCDWFINGFMLLGFAYFISILQNREEKVSKKDLTVMISSIALACGPKAIYFLLMIPLLFIPTDRFKDKKSARITKWIVVAVMISILLTFALPMIVDSASRTDLRGGNDVNSSEQILFILSNPIKYAKICISYMKSYLSLNFMSDNVVLYGWLGIGDRIYSLIAILVLFFCVFTDRSENDGFKGNVKIRVAGLLTGFVQIVCVVTALYVSFTPVAYEWVNGCQYRYVFPTFPIILYCLSPFSIENKMSEKSKIALVFTLMAFSISASFCNVYMGMI